MNKQVIAFEGLDYAGKSTLIKQVIEMMKQDGKPVPTLFAEPRKDTEDWRVVRRMAIDSRVPKSAQVALSIASRVSLYEECVNPALERGEQVFTDRCVLTSMVYQESPSANMFRILDRNYEATLHLEHNAVPDVIVYLPLEHDTYLERIGKGRDEVEEIETHLTKAENFKAFSEAYEHGLRHIALEHGTIIIRSNDPKVVYEALCKYGL